MILEPLAPLAEGLLPSGTRFGLLLVHLENQVIAGDRHRGRIDQLHQGLALVAVRAEQERQAGGVKRPVDGLTVVQLVGVQVIDQILAGPHAAEAHHFLGSGASGQLDLDAEGENDSQVVCTATPD